MLKIKLRPIERENLGLLRDWRNDPEIMQRTRQWRELTMEDQERWFASLHQGKWPENIMWMMVVFSENTTVLVGACGLCHIDWIGRSAELSIYVGAKEWRRKGVAIKAIDLLKQIAFERLNLDNIWAEVYDFNTINAALLIKCGFIVNGTRTLSVYKNGQYWGSHFYLSCKEDLRQNVDL